MLCYNCNSAKHQRGECPHQSGLFLTKDQMERPPPKKKVGSANHQSKLSERKVMRILAELKAGLKQRDIASRYGISTYTVSLIKKGEAWAHVKRS